MGFIKQFAEYFKADPDIIRNRIKTCVGCKFLTKKFRCTQCGCFMKVKTMLAGSKCPIGKL